MTKIESLIQHGKISHQNADKIIENALVSGNKETMKHVFMARNKSGDISDKVFKREHIKKILNEPELSSMHRYALQSNSSHGDDAEDYFAKNAKDGFASGLIAAGNHPGARAEKIVPHLKDLPENSDSILSELRHTPTHMLADVAKRNWRKHGIISNRKDIDDNVAHAIIDHEATPPVAKEAAIKNLFSVQNKLSGDTLDKAFNTFSKNKNGNVDFYDIRNLANHPNTSDKTLSKIIDLASYQTDRRGVLYHPNAGELTAKEVLGKQNHYMSDLIDKAKEILERK